MLKKSIIPPLSPLPRWEEGCLPAAGREWGRRKEA